MKGYYSSLTSPGKVSGCYIGQLLDFSYSHQHYILNLVPKTSVDKQKQTLHEEQSAHCIALLVGNTSHHKEKIILPLQ